MSDQRARELLQRLSRMRGDRAMHESHWTEVAEIFNPYRDDFRGRRAEGEKRMQRVYDGTPGQAAENLASGLWGMMTNSANAWFDLRSQDEDLADDQSVKLWLADTTRRMRSAFAQGGQRFYTRVVDLYSDLVNFGTSVFYVAEGQPGQLFFSCRHLAECYIAESRWERVDTVFRCYQWTARQAKQEWGEEIGPKLLEAADREPDRKFEFLHAVLPVEEYDGRPRGLLRDQQFVGVYISTEDCRVLEERGYYEFPYQVPRWSQRSRSVYGDSPAMLALADAKMLNAMGRTTIVGAQKAVDPPILAPDERTRLGVRTTPGGIIYGGMDPQGRRLYEPLITGSNVGLGLELEEQRREAVRSAFYASLLMLVNQPGRTATEVLALQEEKMRLMGPHLGRVQSEFLDPLIGRVFSIMQRGGAFLPVPEALARSGLRVEYVSPMARQQRTSEAVAVVRTIESIAPLAGADPSVLDGINADEALQTVGNAYGLPPKVLRSPEEVAAIRQQRQQQQAMMAMSEQAPKVAGAVKQMTEAQKIAEEAA